MRVDGQQESENVEDARGEGGGGGQRRPLAMGGGVMGMLLLAVVVYLKGGDVGDFVKQAMQQQAQQPPVDQEPVDPNAPPDPEQEALKRFVGIVLKDTEDVWTEQFQQIGKEYQKPKLKLFSGTTTSACGNATAASGPFYCPGDSKVYLDLEFYDEMKKRFKAPGDFAQAYVVAHEVGHHVQNLLGITEKVDRMRGGPKENEYSVRLELQADYFAGVWAFHANEMRDMLEQGDIEEAMNCAQKIGDDALQQQAQGYVRPETFTHGTSAQRVKWFTKGFKTGKMSGAEELFKVAYGDL